MATVQNRYNLVDRGREDVLSHCAANSIGFIPWFPLAAGELTRPGRLVDRIASAHGATTGQVALAWLVQRSPVILPITGTLRVAHLEENVAAAGLSRTSEEMNSTGSQICYPSACGRSRSHLPRQGDRPSESYAMTHNTGPKISSWAISLTGHEVTSA